MRPTAVAALVMLWLMTNASWAFAQKSDIHVRDKKARANAKIKAKENAPNETWQVEAYGETEKDAVNFAYEKLTDQISTYLFQHGLTDWRPSVEDVGALIKNGKNNSTKTEQANFNDAEFEDLKRATVEFELTPSDVRDLQLRARQHRADGRMLGLSKGLGMFLVLLIALGGYFRLEEATKGYYTTWLRLTTVSFIAAAATGVWLIR